MRSLDGYIPFLRAENRNLTEFYVQLSFENKNCRFTWSIEVDNNWKLHVLLPIHAKITKKSKHIQPRELYHAVCKAFFPKFEEDSELNSNSLINNTENTKINYSNSENINGINEIDSESTLNNQSSVSKSLVKFTSTSDQTKVQSTDNLIGKSTFEYFFAPQNTFQYGRENDVIESFEKYKNQIKLLNNPEDKNLYLNENTFKNISALDDDIYKTYALPKSTLDQLVLLITCKDSNNEDIKFILLLNSSQHPNSNIKSTNSVHEYVNNSSNPLGIKQSKTINNASNQLNKCSDEMIISGIESMNRRLQQLEGENAELKALCQILKQQNLEMQSDLKTFQKSLVLLTEKQFETNLLSYKEFLTISNYNLKQNRIGLNIIHFAEALTYNTIRRISPKKLNYIYIEFKKLFPENITDQSSNLNEIIGNSFSLQNKEKKNLHSIQKDLIKNGKELSKLFLNYQDKFIGELCQSWLLSITFQEINQAKKLLDNLMEKENMLLGSQTYNPRKLSFVAFSRGRLQQDTKIALRDYSFSIKHNPIFFPAYINRGNLFQYSFNSPEKALSDYSVASNFDDSDYSVFYNRGVLYLQKFQNPNLALHDFSRSISINPHHIPSYNNQAQLYRTHLNDPIRALKTLDDAISKNSNCFELYLNRGSLKFECFRSPKDALDDYNIAIKLSPTYASAYVDRAVVSASLGNFEACLSDLNKALTIDPTLQSALSLQEKIKTFNK